MSLNGPVGLIIAFSMMLLAACAEVPSSYERTPSVALEDPQGTTAHNLFSKEVSSNPGRSGFALLFSGESAFVTRSDIVSVAEKTVDAQYFAWDDDQTGKLLIDRLVRAADRGVRVRLLIDDIVTDGLDLGLGHLDNLPNVEVRIFNPFAYRETRFLDFFSDLARVQRRMHNKAMIVDNSVAIVGGRNIGNHYFGVDTVFNYRDLDVLAVGPVVSQISDTFDKFWNSEFAVPMEAFQPSPLEISETRRRQRLLQSWADAGGDQYPYPVLRHYEESIGALEALREELVWPSLVEWLFDDPEKAGGEEESDFVTRGRWLAETLEDEVLIEVAYFVPEPDSIPFYRDLIQRGVRVRVLTNSLASIDVVPAFSGYSYYRERLLRAGVELHELKADVEVARRYWSLLATKSKATLHTKARVFDREWVFVGSFNADPRSRWINTEVGLLMHSPELAERVAAFIESGMDPSNSYKLVLNEERGPGERLTWIHMVDGVEMRERSEPDAPFWLQFTSWLMSMLPIEEYL
jgi:putative cardiolipin synthase